MECTLKKSNSNTEPINRDYFMRHSVRFTNIEMLMIENAFCKHPWISDNISRDQKQLDDSDRIGRIGNLNTAIHFKWKGFKTEVLFGVISASTTSTWRSLFYSTSGTIPYALKSNFDQRIDNDNLNANYFCCI